MCGVCGVCVCGVCVCGVCVCVCVWLCVVYVVCGICGVCVVYVCGVGVCVHSHTYKALLTSFSLKISYLKRVRSGPSLRMCWTR